MNQNTDIKSLPKSSGKNHLYAHWSGKKISRSKAMLAKCCDCMSGYVDGLNDCKVPACPLYPWMPYRDKNKGQTPV